MDHFTLTKEQKEYMINVMRGRFENLKGDDGGKTEGVLMEMECDCFDVYTMRDYFNYFE